MANVVRERPFINVGFSFQLSAFGNRSQAGSLDHDYRALTAGETGLFVAMLGMLVGGA